jgi:sugar lactone lactonase YvrE
LVTEAYKLGGAIASNSITLNVANETAPASLSLALAIPYVVTTLAGSPNATGSVDGTGLNARFFLTWGITSDGAGNLYVTDHYNYTIRKITTAGVVTTVAGSPGVTGTADGQGANARFDHPRDLVSDANGNLYVADASNHVIRKITPAGLVSTVAGSPGVAGTADGNGLNARFNGPYGVALDTSGNLFISDTGNHTIRKMTPDGTVTTLAGAPASAGTADGNGGNARFYLPFSLAVDPSGNLYVADCFNHSIRKVTSTGTVTTVAGNPTHSGFSNGSGTAAQFLYPEGVALDTQGNLWISDCGNNVIRLMGPSGVVRTMAGSQGVIANNDGTGTSACFNNPRGLVVGVNGLLYIGDTANNTIRVLH